jgi:hypothetical protein
LKSFQFMNNNEQMSTDSTEVSVENKPREMTVDEYSELITQWQQTYYAWNSSCVTYYK